MAINSKQILQEVRADIARLDSCVGPHDFVRMEEKIFSKYKCRLCGGTIRGENLHWYKKGMDHAKLNLK